MRAKRCKGPRRRKRRRRRYGRCCQSPRRHLGPKLLPARLEWPIQWRQHHEGCPYWSYQPRKRAEPRSCCTSPVRHPLREELSILNCSPTNKTSLRVTGPFPPTFMGDTWSSPNQLSATLALSMWLAPTNMKGFKVKSKPDWLNEVEQTEKNVGICSSCAGNSRRSRNRPALIERSSFVLGGARSQFVSQVCLEIITSRCFRILNLRG